MLGAPVQTHGIISLIYLACKLCLTPKGFKSRFKMYVCVPVQLEVSSLGRIQRGSFRRRGLTIKLPSIIYIFEELGDCGVFTLSFYDLTQFPWT